VATETPAAASAVIVAAYVPPAFLTQGFGYTVAAAAVGAAAAAVLEAPPKTVTISWVLVALSRGVGYTGLGVLSSYVPDMFGLHVTTAIPPPVIALVMAWVAPLLVSRYFARSGGASQ